MAKQDITTNAELEKYLKTIEDHMHIGTVTIPIKAISGYSDKDHLPANAPETESRTGDSIKWHQIDNIKVNVICSQQRFENFIKEPSKTDGVTIEIIDGRDRVQSLCQDDIQTVRATCYHNIPKPALELISNFTQQYRRRNWIQVYNSVMYLTGHGIDPVAFKNKAFRLKKADVDRCVLISTLHEDLLDGFLSGDKGFNFSVAVKVAREPKEVQEEILRIYQTEGRVDMTDIKRARSKAATDKGDPLTEDDVEEVQAQTWEDGFKFYLSRMNDVCPPDAKYRQILDVLLAMVKE
jgi:hypothetical protein